MSQAALLTALTGPPAARLDALSAWHASAQGRDVVALLVGCDAPACARLFAALPAVVADAAGIVEGAQLGTLPEGGENAAPSPGKVPLAPSSGAFAALSCAAALCTAYVDARHPPARGSARNATMPLPPPASAPRLPPGFAPTLAALHDALLFVPREGSEATSTLAAIQTACERVWLSGLPCGLPATPNVLLHLLADVSAHPEHVSERALKRIWALRGALASIDWNDGGSAPILAYMLRCFSNAGVMRSETGRRILGAAMGDGTNPQLVLRCGAAMRANFPLTGSWPAWYADVLLRAWAAASAATTAVTAADATTEEGAVTPATPAPPSAVSLALECSVLQDLVQRGVHAADPAVFSSVRDVLARFVAARNERGRKDVGSLLTRLYAPILWRALDVPNAAVRKNAATLFRDAFPLTPTGGSGAGSGDTGEQVAALAALAGDVNPAVRELGVGFLADALADNWAFFPALARSRLLATLARHCADSTSPGVRVAGVRGLNAVLVGAPAAHATLWGGATGGTSYLAAAALHLHDRNERVRNAVVTLLTSVDSFKGSFPGGVRALMDMGAGGEESLLARIALDGACPRIASSLARLLLPSFFPPGGDALISTLAKDAAKRIRTSIQRAEAATLTVLAWAHRYPAIVSPELLGETCAAMARAAVRACTAASEGGEEEGAADLATSAPPAAAEEVQGTAEEGVEDEEGAAFVRKRARSGSRRGRAPPRAAARSAPATHVSITASFLRAVAVVWASVDAVSSPLVSVPVVAAEPRALRRRAGGTTDALVASLSVEQDDSAIVRSRLVGALPLEKIVELLSAVPTQASGEGHVSSCLLELAGRAAACTSPLPQGLSAPVWSRLASLSPDASPAALPTLIRLFSLWGENAALVASISTTLHSAIEAMSEALASGSGAPVEELLRSSSDGDVPTAAPLMHPLVALEALHGLYSTAHARAPGLEIADAFAALCDQSQGDAKIMTDEVMDILVAMMRVLPCALDGIAAGAPATPATTLAARCAIAATSVWCSITGHQLSTSLTAHAIEMPIVLASVENNFRDITGWCRSTLLPPVLACLDAQRVAGWGGEICLAAAVSLASIVVSSAADCISVGFARVAGSELLELLTSRTGCSWGEAVTSACPLDLVAWGGEIGAVSDGEVAPPSAPPLLATAVCLLTRRVFASCLAPPSPQQQEACLGRPQVLSACGRALSIMPLDLARPLLVALVGDARPSSAADGDAASDALVSVLSPLIVSEAATAEALCGACCTAPWAASALIAALAQRVAASALVGEGEEALGTCRVFLCGPVGGALVSAAGASCPSSVALRAAVKGCAEGGEVRDAVLRALVA